MSREKLYLPKIISNYYPNLAYLFASAASRCLILFLLIFQVNYLTVLAKSPKVSPFKENRETSKYINLLEKELTWNYTMRNHKALLDIVYEELEDHPRQALPLLEYVLTHPRIFNLAKDNGLMQVVLDNSFNWPVRITIGINTIFTIPPYSSKIIKLTPGYHELIFFSKHLNFLQEITIPAISPQNNSCYLIYNIGGRNSYRICHFNKRKELRKDNDKTRGWPEILRKPECFWIKCTELFPQKNNFNRFARKNVYDKEAPVTSLFRLSAKNWYNYSSAISH